MFCFAGLTVLHVIWACGGFEKWGVIGFARADDADKKLAPVVLSIAALKADVKGLQIGTIEQRINEAQRLRCEAQSKGLNAAVQFYASEVRRRHREYFDLTNGVTFEVPSCADLGWAQP